MLGKYFSSPSNDNADVTRSAASYKKRYFEMPLEEKRSLYKCGTSYILLDDIPLWPVLYKVNQPRIKKMIQKRHKKLDERTFKFKEDGDIPNTPLDSIEKLNTKVSIFQGDITKLEIDAIVNAANESLIGGGGVDGCIHRAAGSSLRNECMLLNGATAGEAKLTCGHKLPAKYIIHTVGPRGKKPSKLKECYENCLEISLKNEIRSIAFCCISTGVFGYPNYDAAHVALQVVRNWLEKNSEKVDRVIFCTFLAQDFDIYQELMADKYFPCESDCIEQPVESSLSKKVEENVSLETGSSQSDISPEKNIVTEAEDGTNVEEEGLGSNVSAENDKDEKLATDLACADTCNGGSVVKDNETVVTDGACNDSSDHSGDHEETENSETCSQDVMDVGSQQPCSQDVMDLGSQQTDQDLMEFGSQPLES